VAVESWLAFVLLEGLAHTSKGDEIARNSVESRQNGSAKKRTDVCGGHNAAVLLQTILGAMVVCRIKTQHSHTLCTIQRHQ